MTAEEKHHAIRPLLKPDAIWQETSTCYNCLPPALRDAFDVVPTDCVSAHPYDPFAEELIASCRDGWVLDCGAGFRAEPKRNVVAYEIVAYPSTDVLGVAEVMPFRDGAFDAVICLNVLEHVKDPFRGAREIARVLRPGGKLYCVVPFLQPLHGYPHHYYNMTAQGLRNLFAATLQVDRQIMLASGLPVWTLNGILKTWRAGLNGAALEEFDSATVAQLSVDPVTLLRRRFVTELTEAKNFELASTTALFATKPPTGAAPTEPATRHIEQVEAELAAERTRAAKLQALLGEYAVREADLDRRLNRIRRSRWWRLRRQLMHAFGYEDRKD